MIIIWGALQSAYLFQASKQELTYVTVFAKADEVPNGCCVENSSFPDKTAVSKLNGEKGAS